MLTEVRDTLLALYERRNDFNADNQIVVDGYTNFVFRDLYGRVYSNHRINRQLKRITAKYNQEEHAAAEQEGREENPFPPITCHMLRHTFCTRMILGGIDLKTVQIIMGHADAETTMRVYASAVSYTHLSGSLLSQWYRKPVGQLYRTLLPLGAVTRYRMPDTEKVGRSWVYLYHVVSRPAWKRDLPAELPVHHV